MWSDNYVRVFSLKFVQTAFVQCKLLTEVSRSKKRITGNCLFYNIMNDLNLVLKNT